VEVSTGFSMNFVATFWFLVVGSLVGLIWVLISPSRISLGFVFLFSLLALAWAGFWNWLLRDGLGPDSVTSTGIEALRRFGSDMLLPGCICGSIVGVALVRYFLSNRKTHDVS
jgi:hypothetical protein